MTKHTPVAWMYRDSWGTLKLSQIMPPPIGAFPVYTTPPAAQRKPLTDKKLNEIAAQGYSRWVEFARAIEAAHGITKGQP
jgi:hypothetical protein